MNANSLVTLVLLFVCAAAVWLAVFVAIPAARTAWFAADVTELRDRVDDEYLLTGNYRAEPSIEAFRQRANLLVPGRDNYTLLSVLAVYRTVTRHALLPAASDPYRHLPLDVQARMGEYEDELVLICARRLLPAGFSGLFARRVADRYRHVIRTYNETLYRRWYPPAR